MSNTLFSFLLTIFAGFATMIGTFFIFVKKKNHNIVVVSALAFAAGVMITVSITDLVPESINLLRGNLSTMGTIFLSLLGLLLGIVVSMLIDYYLPDKPIFDNKDKSLFKVGIISMIAIILHNIPEDCSCYVSR